MNTDETLVKDSLLVKDLEAACSEITIPLLFSDMLVSAGNVLCDWLIV